MSSAVLYLAIVAVWAVVLVPMWLRRDSRILHKTPLDETSAEESPPAPRRPGRATVIARRRRRTAGLFLLLATTAGIVAAGLAPWWITLPPSVLLAGHLALLRVAVAMDADRHRERQARAREARLARESAAPQAEIIELVAPTEVFDQYADDRPAVGE